MNWNEIQREYRRAIMNEEKLALAYSNGNDLPPHKILEQLIAIAKYLSRTGKSITQEQIQQKLHISHYTLNLGLNALQSLGFTYQENNHFFQIFFNPEQATYLDDDINLFLEAIEEEQFKRHYFSQIPISTLQEILTN